MVLAGGALALVELLLVVYCVMSVVTTPHDQLRHLPKAGWLVLVVVLPLFGGVAWLLAGRPADPSSSSPVRRGRGAPAASPDDDAAFLRQLRDRADAQRAQAQRDREQRDEDERRGPPDGPAPS